MNNPSLKPTSGSALSAPDKTVLVYGVIAALLGVAMNELMAHRAWPWGRPYALYFIVQWLTLAPLAGAMLAGMTSARRWLVALAVYGLILPAITAYGLTAAFGSLPNERGGWLRGSEMSVALLLTGTAGFILLPVIQALDATRAQWNYPAVFRAAWRNAVHLALSLFLAGAVCLLLTAAGAMFKMIGIGIVQRVVENSTFRYAVWPMILAACLVGVRRRPALTDTLQRSWLTLNAWLLPLVTLVGVAFTLALAARMALGLQAVQLSAGALIAFSLVWIKLINAAWQDHADAAPFGARLGGLLRAAMVCLLPLAAVALYGAIVRVDQYGWTVLRAWGVAASGILVLYGAGYSWAALRPKRYYPVLGATNLIAAAATLAVLVAFITPIANPMRLTAQSQLQRMIDGRLDPHEFTYYRVGEDFGKWGVEAVQQLADGAANARDPRIAAVAKEALKSGYFRWADNEQQLAQDMANVPAFTTIPANTEVPASWWAYLVQTYPSQAKTCATPAKPGVSPGLSSRAGEPRCQLVFADLTGDGRDDIVLYVTPPSDVQTSTVERLPLYSPDAAGKWNLLGHLKAVSFSMDTADETGVSDLQQALKQGLVRTQPRTDRDLRIGDNLFRLR
jgi:hypothetical protein